MLWSIFVSVCIVVCVAAGVVFSIRLVDLRRRMRYLWANSTDERRNEYMNVYLFYKNWHMPTGLTMSRAYHRIIDDYFGWSKWGLINKAVIIVPLYQHTTRGSLVAIGTRSVDRRKCWTFDVGATGMCSATMSVEENAKNELFEEMGLRNPIVLDKVLMPHDGYGAIVYVYKTNLGSGDCPPELQSTDGTFDKIDWVENNSESIMRYANTEVRGNPNVASGNGVLFTANMSKILVINVCF